MSSSDVDNAFEKGAGFSVSQSAGMFEGMTSMFLLIAVAFVVLGTYLSWRNGNLKFEDLVNYLVRSIALLIFVSGFIVFVRGH